MPVTLLPWLKNVAISDSLQRRNAVAMQVVFMVLGVALPILGGIQLAVTAVGGYGRFYLAVHLLLALLAWSAFALVRFGFLRFASAFFVIGVLIVLVGLYGALGLQAQRFVQFAQILPMALAGLIFGRRALWLTWLLLVVCLTFGAVHDLAVAGRVAMAGDQSILVLVARFLVAAVIFDGAVAAVYAGLRDVQLRGLELEAARRRLLEEKEEREQAMEQLIHGEKMTALGQLAGGVAHDFNNVLGVILGYSQWRRRHSDPEQLKEALAGIENAARRGAAISRKLLSFSRYDVAHQEVFDVGEALRVLEGMLRQLFDPRVQVAIIQAEQPLPIRFDRGQFELAILNIATNARDAMREGGRFRVAVEALDGWAQVHLSDTGEGMSEAVRARIFEPFFTTKPDGGGTGLGLAVVGKVISDAGGEIRVESEPGRGTCFCLRFPLVERVGLARPSGDQAPQVLLVDDDDELRVMLATALEDGGCRVLCARDGNEAERLVRRGDVPDVLVTGYRMPGMNGLTLIQRLRALHPEMPMVLISDQMPEAGSLAGQLPPDVERLPKPFSPDLLLKYVYMLASWVEERGRGESL